jgi:hypothetical protein
MVAPAGATVAATATDAATTADAATRAVRLEVFMAGPSAAFTVPHVAESRAAASTVEAGAFTVAAVADMEAEADTGNCSPV